MSRDRRKNRKRRTILVEVWWVGEPLGTSRGHLIPLYEMS